MNRTQRRLAVREHQKALRAVRATAGFIAGLGKKPEPRDYLDAVMVELPEGQAIELGGTFYGAYAENTLVGVFWVQGEEVHMFPAEPNE